MKKIKCIFLATAVVLSIVGIMTIGFGLLSHAEEMEIKSEPVTVNAEDIGIETIENDAVIEEVIENEIVDDSEDITEEEISDEYIKDDFIESEDEIVTDDSALENEPEVESSKVPEGMCEGYEEGIYFEPNHFGDCELHEYCYICEEHEFESEYFWDEDINPRYGWVYSETCVICGHGTCKPVKEIKE